MIAFVGLSVVPVVLVGIYGIITNVNTLKTSALNNLTHDVRTMRERAGNFLAGVESDMRVLRHQNELEAVVANLAFAHDKPDPALLHTLALQLLGFSRAKGMYYQLRIVSGDQDELLRVQCDDIANGASTFRIVPDSELRSGTEAFYTLLTESLEVDTIAFAPTEMSYRTSEKLPVISFALPLVADGKRVGILVANVFAGALFTLMEPGSNAGADERVALVAEDGHYLYTSETRNNWNKLIAERQEDNLQHDYAKDVATQILSGAEGIAAEGTDDIIAYTPLFAGHVATENKRVLRTFTVSPVLFESVPLARITGPARAFAWTFVVLLAVFLVAAVWLGLLATRQFTRPIAELQQGADIIAHGNYKHRLRVSTRDEIEKLAEQFNTMAAALEVHEQEIARQQLHLEDNVASRTMELVDERSKLRAILDNVPSAFVLLDPEFHIQTASAAFSAITGSHVGSVTGRDSRDVLGVSGFCATPFSSEAARHGDIQSHIDLMVDDSGTERVCEHFAIPLFEHLSLHGILEIITDITKRRRLEQQMIQSEKLMATGEMAAIIAHEFRNALTSVKMILQLQREAKGLDERDKKSMEVALDSILHMESIVRELLTFARPSPMQFRMERIDAIIEECCAMLKLRMRADNITLTTNIDPRIPPSLMDGTRIKEAIINIMINALQAMESAGPVRSGTLTVQAWHKVLASTVRDLLPVNAAEENDDGAIVPVREIVLREGTACIVITINDSGPGISPESMRRIFDPFFTTKPNGTGLGLPMVKRTVNAHGGILVVRSNKREGTTFEMMLPVRSEHS